MDDRQTLPRALDERTGRPARTAARLPASAPTRRAAPQPSLPRLIHRALAREPAADLGRATGTPARRPEAAAEPLAQGRNRATAGRADPDCCSIEVDAVCSNLHRKHLVRTGCQRELDKARGYVDVVQDPEIASEFHPAIVPQRPQTLAYASVQTGHHGLACRSRSTTAVARSAVTVKHVAAMLLRAIAERNVPDRVNPGVLS